MNGDVVADSFGRSDLHLVFHQIERGLNPGAAFIGSPVKRLSQHIPLSDGRQLGPLESPKRPVRFACVGRITGTRRSGSAGGDPALEQILLAGRQRGPLGHFIPFHQLPQTAVMGLARHDDRAARAAARNPCRNAEVQLAVLLKRPMALDAAILQ